MAKYLLKRLFHSFISVIGITFLVFFVLNLSGDPVMLIAPASATISEIERLRETLGYNDPLLMQYWRFLKGAAVLDFGQSYYYHQPAMNVVLERLPNTIYLAGMALCISLLIGIPAGVISAVKRNTLVDSFTRVFALLGQCMPGFWIGLMLMILFSVILRILPTTANPKVIKSMLLPAFTLSLPTAAMVTRLLRSNMIEVMSKEYIDVAKAKGLPRFQVIMKHGFKNAISSLLTVLGMQIATMMGGAVIIETVFSYPGVGRLAVNAITNRDFMVMEAIVFIIAVIFLFVNLAVDLLYSIINPRVRLQ